MKKFLLLSFPLLPVSIAPATVRSPCLSAGGRGGQHGGPGPGRAERRRHARRGGGRPEGAPCTCYAAASAVAVRRHGGARRSKKEGQAARPGQGQPIRDTRARFPAIARIKTCVSQECKQGQHGCFWQAGAAWVLRAGASCPLQFRWHLSCRMCAGRVVQAALCHPPPHPLGSGIWTSIFGWLQACFCPGICHAAGHTPNAACKTVRMPVFKARMEASIFAVRHQPLATFVIERFPDSR